MSVQSSSSFSPAQRVRVSDQEVGRRLDNFLLSRVDAPRSAVYRWVRTGQVRVNRRRASPSQRLAEGDEVRIPPHREDAQMDSVAPPEIEIPVLYEDKDLLVVNKPSGLAVHGGSRLRFGMIDVLRLHRGEESLELAHRLDRGTSGCLIVARNRPALLGIQRQLRKRQAQKYYRLLVHGCWPEEIEEVRQSLRVNRRRARGRKVVADASGQTARTRFQIVEQFAADCLLEAQITTGRTHQIRVHAQQVGHPVVGDDRYGQRSVNQKAKAQGFRRMFLHAHAVEFAHPVHKKIICAQAPLDAECEDYLDALRTSKAKR